MKRLLLVALLAASPIYAQNWSSILTPTASGNYSPTPAAGAAPGVAIDWSNTGIPGGVAAEKAAQTQCGSTISAPSSTSAILSALSSCGGSSGAHKYVKLGAGTFSINAQLLSIPSYTQLRGSGPTQTILNLTGNNPTICSDTYGCAINLGTTGDVGYSPLTVTAGATAGSTSMTLSSMTGVATGNYLIISETNAAWVSAAGGEGQCNWCDGSWTGNGNRARGQIVEITGVSGNVATISPALYTDYTNTPTVVATTMTKYASISDLQVFDNDSYTSSDPVDISMNRCAYCYVQNVEQNYTAGDFLHITWGYRDEVRDSYFSNSFLHAAGCCDAAVNVQYKSSAFKIENNIIERGHASMMMEWGSNGGVIGYNYEMGAYHNPTTFVIGGVSMHGAHPQFILIEGNAMTAYYPDQVWGSSSHNTLFRNWIRGTTLTCPPYTDGQRNTVNCASGSSQSKYSSIAAQIAHWSWYDNFVGDVLGSSQQQALGTVTAILNYPGSRNAFSTLEWNMSFGYGESNDDASGDGCAGGTAPCHGTQPAQTAFLYKEYTFANTTSNCTVGGNAGSCTASLPPSFYLASKPSWWGSLAWPSVGPDISGGAGPGGHIAQTYANPAMNCYLHVMGGIEGGTGSPLSFDANNCYAGGPTSTGSSINPGTHFTAGVVVQ